MQVSIKSKKVDEEQHQVVRSERTRQANLMTETNASQWQQLLTNK